MQCTRSRVVLSATLTKTETVLSQTLVVYFLTKSPRDLIYSPILPTTFFIAPLSYKINFHHLPLFLASTDILTCSTTMAMAFMMATKGMCVTEECKKSFMEMKWKKVHRYIVYKIDEKSKLVTVDKVGSSGESYDDLAASLPEDDCRYAVFDFDFVTVDNCRKSKIFFIAWAPTASRIRAKILYATSKDGLRRALDGISYEVQATDAAEMGFDVITDRAK